jgi:glycosyltransferase involved in cell wall biosynthesis
MPDLADSKLLLISYLFPPAGGIPVQRALSMARYLPQNGYEVHVLCCRNPGVPTLDPSLVKRIPPEVRVHRVFSPELPFSVRQAAWAVLAPRRKAAPPAEQASRPAGRPSAIKQGVQAVMRRIFCPDPEVLWVPFALRRARRLIREHGIDTVMITVPPYSSLMVGLRLKHEFPNLKFIADFRDEWLEYYLNATDFYRGDYIRARATALEREVATYASLVTAVTPSTHETMKQRYADLPQDKFALIYNGYDPEPFTGFHARPHGTGKVVISYAGTLHGTSSPKPYFDALDNLPDNLRDQVETRLMGRITGDEAQHLEGRKSAIRKYGFLPQAEVFRHLEETDFLMMIQLHAPSLGGKFFEYMATGKPILAISPDHGETARVIRETGSGMCAFSSSSTQAPGSGEAMLTRAIESVRQGKPFCTQDRSAVERFDRRQQAAEYARLMREARP